MFADKAARLALTRDETEPVQRPVLRLGMVSTIFNMIPHAHHDGEQFVANHFIICNRIQ
ncbi:hypothetical protein D3C85_1121890 [compost metagenome]